LYVRWSLLGKRVRGCLLAVRAIQPRLGYPIPGKRLGTYLILADPIQQVAILFATPSLLGDALHSLRFSILTGSMGSASLKPNIFE